MKLLILVLIVVCANMAFATAYYVGGAGASDNNPGTAAQPFETIQKAASVAVAGDVVNIRSGTYRETIVPANSGTPGNPIIFQPDGGSSVIISGLNTADGGWSVHNGGIYKKSITLPVNGYNAATSNNTTLLANQIFKDGVMMFEARWPNLGVLDDMLDRNKVRRMPSTPTSTTIVDAAAPAGMTGATIWVNGWYVTMTAKVTGHSGSTITFSPSQSDLKKRKMYYLTGKLSLLDAEKEWHYESGTLYFRQVGSGTPTGIEYKARNYGFDLSSRTGINLVGLGFIGCTPAHGNTSTNNVIIDNIRASYMNHAVLSPLQSGTIMNTCYFNAEQTGIKLIGSNNVIKNSELKYASSQCIWLGENGIAQNNLIHDIGYDGNFGCGVMPWGPNIGYGGTGGQKIMWNTVYRTGRSSFDAGHSEHGQHLNMEIGYNDMSDYGKLNTDVGALYVGHFTNTTGLRTHHNWIHKTGTVFDDGIVGAIYYDQGSGPHTTDHNVCWDNMPTSGTGAAGSAADYYSNPFYENRNAGSSNIHNNVFASTSSLGSTFSMKISSGSNTTPVDLQRNNIYRQDVVINFSSGARNIANSLNENVDPQFVGTGIGGLAYRLKSTSPGINKGAVVAGITDGSVGAPDIGAYENGGTDWIPGYKAVATAPNTPPVVALTSPADNASFAQGSPITISATASDDGTITRVEFFSGTTKVGEDLTGPYSFVWNNAPAGTIVLTARASDNANSTTTSSPVTITITANATPTVAITGPANNSQFITGSAINIDATAADANGSVTKVEFYSGTTKVGEDLTSPYTFVWSNPTTGTHALMAKAVDDMNSVSSSAIVTVQVSPNTPPTVVITGPANNTQFITGASINITATAADANGSITKVEFFSGTTKLGEDLTSPYSFIWNNAAIGTYALTANAIDNLNTVTSSAIVTVSVSANPPPTVVITGPANNAQFIAGTSINITAAAADTNGSVTKVEFFNGTTKLGEDLTSPYGFVWINATVGSYSLTAKATDDQNSVTTSAIVTVSVSPNPPPTVAITSPANNAQFITGASINIAATAADINGSVTKVEFFNGTTKLGEDLTSPYSFAWTNATTGTYSLTAKATDNENSVASSAIVTVSVSANPPPTVVITGPENNTEFITGTPITITANASDVNGTVSKVEFFRGTTKLGEDASSPFSFIWTNAPLGSYSITARATDNQVAVATSAVVSVSVVATNTAPVVNITSPSSNAVFQSGTPITITANASDADGTITKVEFYRGTTKLGEDATSPYSFSWANAAIGNYSIIAKAIDNDGLVTSSSPVPCSVIANAPPVVTLTSPVNNASFDAGSSITLLASASDPNGTVSKVEFYNGTGKLGEDLTSPYSFTWNNVPAGNYSITAKATDNQNAVSTSSAINLEVNVAVGPASPPTVFAGTDTTLTLPINSLSLIGEGAASDGSLISFQWTQISGPGQATIANSSMPEITVTNLIAGAYVFELTGTSATGLSTKDQVMITIVGESLDLQSSIPRFFSPNDDGNGDFWEWTQLENFENSLLTVFNRSGQKIYEAVSYKNTWDGKSGDAPLQAGDYYYIVQLVNKTLIKGALQIIR